MLTSIQIAVLADLHEARSRDKEGGAICVWGSWQRAAHELLQHGAVDYLGETRGTRQMEWHNLGGRHRRGKEGRLVHVYRLASGNRDVLKLAERCARAVKFAKKNRLRGRATWKDVELFADLPDGDQCPRCRCTPSSPCTIVLADGRGTANCAAAGQFGFKACSACLAKKQAA